MLSTSSKPNTNFNYAVPSYAVEGLSPDRFRVLLHPIQEQTLRFITVDGHTISRDTDHGADVVLWETRDSTDGQWRTAEVVYTCRQPHQVRIL